MIDLENQEREIINLMFSQRISWLAAVRIRHKLSLAEVSKMLGISINSLKQIEKTERLREGANKQVISSQADSLIKISRIWA
ncbi:sigma factor-like helix-turn-helix DNA-binding protein, partial [Escherichia coli]